jgi:hypothetical protein
MGNGVGLRVYERLGAVAVAVTLAATLGLGSVSAQVDCNLRAPDRAWVNELIDAWRGVSREDLRIDPDPLPLIIVFNESCQWTFQSGVDLSKATGGTAHIGSITLPDGGTAPAGLASFAGSYDSSAKPYLVMAMPSIWRADPKLRDEPRLPLLIRAVFAHEMTHTVQAGSVGQWLTDVEKRLGSPEDFDDDIIQTRFENDTEFKASFTAERSLLYQAAAEPNAGVRRALVATAAGMIETRRGRYFTGDNAVYAEVEDVFLNMEGLGQWVAYRVAVREGMSEADAVDFIRRGRNRWSQEEGLAAFLVIDAMLPGWRARVLEGKPASVLQLLSEAARRSG